MKGQQEMTRKILHRIVTVLIASVWLGFGLFGKVLHMAPRHEQIVARILGTSYADPLTRLIGVCEVLMVLWILSRFKQRLNAILQMTVIGTMNLLEAIFVPDLLLFGRLNALVAIAFIAVIYTNEWVLNQERVTPP